MEVVLLGGDLNAYSVAVSFHQAFGVRSTVFCRYRCGITGYSSLIDLRIEKDLLDDAVGTRVLLEFARGKKEQPYLIPCGDWYVAFLSRNRDSLAQAYRFHIPSKEIFQRVSDKAEFYAMLQKENIPYPETAILTSSDLSLSAFLSVGEYPIVLKPSQSVCYYEHPFPNMEKVYFPKNPKEAMDTAEKIFSSGYNKKIILQKRIGTEDAPPISKTLTLLSDHNGYVRRGVLGEVLVEEREKGARGNYAAILTRPPDALTCRLLTFVEKMGYTGISNFDILSHNGKQYVLELNPRQGRSCDYLRVAGISLARFIVDAIEKKKIATDLSSRIGLWHAVPFGVVYNNVAKSYRNALISLRKKGRAFSAFGYKGERKTIVRCAYCKIHALRRTLALRSRKVKKDEKRKKKGN